MIYYGTFLLSGFWCWIAEILFKKKSQTLGIVMSVFSILSLTWLCGVRDFSIGTDIGVYGEQAFQTAVKSLNLLDYINNLKGIYGTSGSTEYGYVFLNYIVSKFTNNTHIFLFVIGLIVNGIIFVSIYLLRDRVSLVLGWLTFCFLFFGTTLNLLRQSIAISLVLLGIVLLYKRSTRAALIPFILAIIFHNSAVFALLIYIMGLLINKAKLRSKVTKILFIFTIIIMLMPRIVAFLNEHGLLNDKYYQYIMNTNNGISLNSILIRLPMLLLIIFIMWRKRNKLDKYNAWLYMLVVQEILLIPLQSMGITVARLMLYFGVAKIIAYPMALEEITVENKIMLQIMKLCYVLMLMIIFYEQVIVAGNNQIYPFIFAM